MKSQFKFYEFKIEKKTIFKLNLIWNLSSQKGILIQYEGVCLCFDLNLSKRISQCFSFVFALFLILNLEFKFFKFEYQHFEWFNFELKWFLIECFEIKFFIIIFQLFIYGFAYSN